MKYLFFSLFVYCFFTVFFVLLFFQCFSVFFWLFFQCLFTVFHCFFFWLFFYCCFTVFFSVFFFVFYPIFSHLNHIYHNRYGNATMLENHSIPQDTIHPSKYSFSASLLLFVVQCFSFIVTSFY